MLNADEPGSGLHYLVLVHLRMLYAPDLLDRPERLAAVEEKIRRVTK